MPLFVDDVINKSHKFELPPAPIYEVPNSFGKLGLKKTL